MNNNDMISRAAACDEIGKMIHEYLEKDDHDLADALILARRYVLKRLPAVDAVPVVHARWTTERTCIHDGEWYCSACEYEPIVFMESNYCPHCGAKMDGDPQ